MQFRHKFKVHAVPSDKQRQGQKDDGDDRKDPHGGGLFELNLQLIHFADLHNVFPQGFNMTVYALGTVRKPRKELTLVVGQHLIGIGADGSRRGR